jgi:hypothetical protein
MFLEGLDFRQGISGCPFFCFRPRGLDACSRVGIFSVAEVFSRGFSITSH